MKYHLFDDVSLRTSLLPLTYLRPVCGMRVGVFTIREKWENYLGSVSVLTSDYLQDSFPVEMDYDNILINGALCPSDSILKDLNNLKPGEGLVSGDILIAARVDKKGVQEFLQEGFQGERTDYSEEVILIDRTWKIFQNNGNQLKADIAWLSSQKKFNKVKDSHTAVYGEDNVFIGDNVTIKSAVIDAENGPVYLADNTVVSPGSVIRGSFAMLEGSEINMGGRMRGDITIGPRCKVGGEVSNSVFFGYSNKAHDGFVGNSVIAEWCNLGADTNTSNMKNDYSDVKVWNYNLNRFENTGSTFCGLVMGDHSKSGINVMFNTGTSVGVSCSIYNANYPRNIIPSFVKGGANGWSTMSLKEASLVASRAMSRRKKEFSSRDQQLFEKVFELSASYRRA